MLLLDSAFKQLAHFRAFRPGGRLKSRKVTDKIIHSDPSRREYLARINRASTEYRHSNERLAEILGKPIPPEVRFDLAETDRMIAKLRESVAKAQTEYLPMLKRTWPYHPLTPWQVCCKCIGDSLGDEDAILFAGPFTYCGAIRVEVNRALANLEALLSFDGDTVSLQSANSDAGLYLDKFEEDSMWQVELVAWGAWVTKADECLVC